MYKIQRATINDVPEIAQFAAKTFSDTFQHYSPEDLKNHLRKTCSESYFSNQINNTENKTIIIKENNNIIAYAKYGKLELPVNNPVFPSNELHRLYVDPKNKYSGKPIDENHPVSQFSNAFYSNENMETILSGSCPEGFDAEDKQVGRQLRSLSRTAPIALIMASGLIDDATNAKQLDDGLALELDRLCDIFGTSDALEGLSALIEGRRPEYTNN